MEGHVRRNEVRNVSFEPIVGISLGIPCAAIASAVTRFADRQQPCGAYADVLQPSAGLLPDAWDETGG